MNLQQLLLLMIFVPIVLGFLPLCVKETKKLNLAIVTVSILELLLCLYLMFTFNGANSETIIIEGFFGLGLTFKINGLGILQAVATSLIWVGSSVFSNEYFEHDPSNLRRYYAFWSVTLGATLGIFLAADLFTLFIFFEAMSFASYPLVAHNQDEQSIKAGNSYLTIAVLGGLVVLSGILVLYATTGTVDLDQLAVIGAPYANQIFGVVVAFLIFFGFAAKAGMFPLNGWLPKAHPAAPAPASAALSGILIKTGVYGVILVTLRFMQHNTQWAIFILVIGVLTMLIGAVSAFLSVNLKETLAFSSMSQIGFITIGVAMTQILGEHGTIAAYGTVLHMINHTLIKLVLFTCAGIVYQNTHSLDLNKIQGFGRGKKALTFSFGVASLGIMGVPLFNGYISKTLLHEAIVEKIWLFESYTFGARMFQLTEMIFLLSGGFTVAYMTKLFICLFVRKANHASHAEENHKRYVTARTATVIVAVSVLIFVLGAFPHATLDKIAESTSGFMGVHPLDHAVHYFSFVNLKGAIISLGIGMLLYFGVARLTVASKEKGYYNPWKPQYTVENLLWKPLLFKVFPFVFGLIGRIVDKIPDMFLWLFQTSFMQTAKIPQTFFEGKKEAEDEASSSPAFHITNSLAYSLLLFSIGFVIIMAYLLISGS